MLSSLYLLTLKVMREGLTSHLNQCAECLSVGGAQMVIHGLAGQLPFPATHRLSLAFSSEALTADMAKLNGIYSRTKAALSAHPDEFKKMEEVYSARKGELGVQ